MPLVHALTRQRDAWSPRQRRHLSAIAEFNCTLTHLPGKKNLVADALSRIEINAVQLGLDYNQLAKEQQQDPETTAVRTAITALQWEDVPLGDSNTSIFCDVSTGRPRPWIPSSLRRHIFNLIHGLSHPSRRATTRLLTQKFICHKIPRDAGNWEMETEEEDHDDKETRASTTTTGSESELEDEGERRKRKRRRRGSEFCKLFTVRLMIGSPSGTVGTGVYRNILDLIEPAQNLVSYVQAVTSTTDFNGHPQFGTSLIGETGALYCWPQVSDCPCTINRSNQRVQVDLGAPRTITTLMLYRVILPYDNLSYNFEIYIGNNGDTTDTLFIFDEESYGPFPYKKYDDGK
ncbi:hypothetical protein Pcinc_023275 [Petrolisthes cinctipes]|uniref:Uncharacterized protein n=1 Tax=Petrolisthes cinctipes TaxID=88211 RepID=A0AAE1FCW2_PETCI|nr:hypothetical protein Pcinc_023275 [Petrolisthes cinctipes]